MALVALTLPNMGPMMIPSAFPSLRIIPRVVLNHTDPTVKQLPQASQERPAFPISEHLGFATGPGGQSHSNFSVAVFAGAAHDT
jgi:hypothetical protein